MNELRFYCNAVETFDLSALPQWVIAHRTSGEGRDDQAAVEVIHADREMDGSCRWCGCRANETIIVRAPSQDDVASS